MAGGLADRAADSVLAVPRPAPLLGLQVLVVEDERLVCLMLEEMLIDFGCIVAGIATSIAEAQATIGATPEIDAAVLDVNLAGQFIFPVADLLERRGVPLVFATGYGPVDLPQRYPGRPVLRKPYAAEDLASALRAITSGALH